MIPGIATNAAFHAQLLLVHESTAVALVVIVIGRDALHAISAGGSDRESMKQMANDFFTPIPLELSIRCIDLLKSSFPFLFPSCLQVFSDLIS